MNHNFANWEITQLLPNTNPFLLNRSELENQFNVWEKPESFSILYPYWNDRKYLDFGYLLQYSEQLDIESHYQHSKFLRDVWTWEDIRLYLKEKGFIITINYWNKEISDDFNKGKRYSIIINKDGNSINDNHKEYFDTYEEAREYSIIHCFNIINSKK